MRLSRFARSRRITTPFLWGWSVFTFSSTIPTHTYGVMLSAGLQFDPYREKVLDSPFGIGTTFRRPFISFTSYATSSTGSSVNTSITSVSTGSGGYGLTTSVTQSNTSVNGKQTKNRIRVDSFFSGTSPFTIDSISVECAIGRL